MRRRIIIGWLALLLIGVLARAEAGRIEIVGNTVLNVNLVDAERVDALTALFATTNNRCVLALHGGVGGRIPQLQMLQVTFDQALTAILTPDYTVSSERREDRWLYRVSSLRQPAIPAILPVAPPAGPSGPSLPASAAAAFGGTVDLYQSIHINTRTDLASLGAGGGSVSLPSVNMTPRKRGAFISVTDSIPIILMSTTQDVFGRSLRNPEIYWETFTNGISVNSAQIYPPNTVGLNITPFVQAPATPLGVPGASGQDTSVSTVSVAGN